MITAIGSLATGIFFGFNVAGLKDRKDTDHVTLLPLHKDMIFCVLIYQIVPNILTCGYEVMRLHYDKNASFRTHALSYSLLALATVFSIAAPAVYGAVSPTDSSKELKSTILTFCASVILVCNGCIGVFEIANRKNLENIQAQELRLQDVEAERNQLRHDIEAQRIQFTAKRRWFGLKKKPKVLPNSTPSHSPA